MHELEDISTRLKPVLPRERNGQLASFLAAANAGWIRGGYFPTIPSTAPHYRVLRVVPTDARCLNSRDKVPFILYLEVEPTHRLCGDPALDQLDVLPALPDDLGATTTTTTTSDVGSPVAVDSAAVPPRSLEPPPPPPPPSARALVPAQRQRRHQLVLLALVQRMTDDLTGVSIRTRWMGLSSFPKCCVGSDLVDWMLRPPALSPAAATAAALAAISIDSVTASDALDSTPVTPDALLAQCKTRPMAVQLGRSLVHAGLLRHVTDACDFADSGDLFSFVVPPAGMAAAADLAATDDDFVLVGPVTASVAQPFGEPWAQRRLRLQAASPFGGRPGWDLMSVIFKAGDDLRQEQLCMQVIDAFDVLFRAAGLSLRLRPYRILVVAPTAGLVETLPDAVSVHCLKESFSPFQTLAMFFDAHFRAQGAGAYAAAVRCYVESLAAYSIVSYLLAIKDRHNGNIMLAADGSIIHIDFGFMLSTSPGGNMGFESSPFKLTDEYLHVMDEEAFGLFKVLFIAGFLEARKHRTFLCLLIEIVASGPPPHLHCFSGDASPAAVLDKLHDRFFPALDDDACVDRLHALIDEATNNWRSVQYDQYQRVTNGIL